MADMARAIRTELQKWGATLRDLPDDVLNEYSQIVTAFSLDLRDEQARRDRRTD